MQDTDQLHIVICQNGVVVMMPNPIALFIHRNQHFHVFALLPVKATMMRRASPTLRTARGGRVGPPPLHAPFCQPGPCYVRTILTDDGSEFIDFRSNCQKQASGEYEFDRLWQRWRLSTD